MAFEDVDIPVRVTADTSDLRKLIAEFDGSAEAAKRLEQATADVKEQFNSQRKAIAAYNSATRTQNFQLIQSLRLVNSVSFLFRNLNQVYQTLILRQIQNTQQTVAEQEAFDNLSKSAGNIVNALDILGPANEEVNDALSDLIQNADRLDSDNLEKFIERFERAGAAANFSAEEQAKFNETLEKLNKLLEETKADEAQRQFDNLFGTIIAGGAAAGSLGQFVLQLSKFEAVAKLFRGGAPAGAGLAALVLLLPQLLRAFGIDPAPVTETLPNGQQRGEDSFTRGFENAIKKLEELSKIDININNPTFNSEIDLEKSMDIITAKLKEKEGFGTLQ